MKKILFNLSVLPLAIFMISWGFLSKKTFDFSYYSTDGLELYFDVPFANEYDDEVNTHYYPVMLGKSFMGFKDALGFKESRNDYFVVNDYGYMGKYQFGKSTLKQIGIRNHDDFLNNPKLQESAVNVYLSRNKWVLRNDIQRYSGRYIGGVYITESGVLAAAHLAGPGNVKRFLRSGGEDVFSDGFGTTVKYYLRKFSGYDTSHIIPNKDAKVKV